MPKWIIYSTAGTFSNEEKQHIAKEMTAIYTSIGLPAFYTVTQFIEYEQHNNFSGGELSVGHINIGVYHAAKPFAGDEVQDMWFRAFDDVFRPICKPKGILWESAVYETNIAYWRMNGLVPPLIGSDMAKKWFKANAITDEEELFRNQKHP